MRTIDVRGDRVPVIGLGTWLLEGAQCREAVVDALAIGYRLLDTAQAYGNEADVGAGLAEGGVPRARVWLTTKIWPSELGRDRLGPSVERSLEKLRTGYVDLLMIHWPSQSIPMEESLEVMAGLREQGLARHLGVCNFTASMVARAARVTEISCIQVEYHVYLSQRKLLDAARARGLFVTAYSPLAKGRVLQDQLLQRIAQARGKTAAQVALRWLLQQERVVAIPKAADHDHRRANFQVLDFELTADEMERISQLERGERLIDPPTAPEWEAEG